MIITFTDAANEMCGNILVVDPPSGQVENYIPGRPLTAGEKNYISLFFNFLN